MQLAGDKVGIENAAWLKQESDLAGHGTALKIARENHNVRLKAIADADVKDAKDKLDKQVADDKAANDKLQSQLDTATNAKMQLANDKIGIENAAWAKEEENLKGNTAALAIARENHNTRLKAIEDADAADAKAKLDKQVTDDKAIVDKKIADKKTADDAIKAQQATYASQLDAALNAQMQLAGDKVGLENAAWQKEEISLAGNAAA